MLLRHYFAGAAEEPDGLGIIHVPAGSQGILQKFLDGGRQPVCAAGRAAANFLRNRLPHKDAQFAAKAGREQINFESDNGT